MQQPDLSTLTLSLDPAIDRRPLIVTPDTSLSEAVLIMGKAQSSCTLPGLNLLQDTAFFSEARATGILVVEGSCLTGLLTESDVVRAITQGQSLAQVKVGAVMQQTIIASTPGDTPDVFAALSVLRQHQIRHLPIVDEQRKPVGMVTLESIRQVLQLDELLKSRQLRELVSPPVVQAPITTSALTLAQLMTQYQVNSIVLTSAEPGNLQPAGIIRAQDIIQLQALQLDLSQVQAQTMMSTPLLCLSPSETVLAAHWEMQQRGVQRFIVCEESGELLGIVGPTSFLQTLDLNLMRSSVEQLQRSIDQFKTTKAAQTESNWIMETQVLPNPAELLEQLECNRLLAAMALRIRESLNLNEILNTAVAEVRQFLQTERVIIYRFNPDFSGTVVVESVAAGWQPALNNSIRDTCFGKNYAQGYKEGRTLVAEDIYTAGFTQCHIDILALYDVRASLVVPIVQGEHLWGLLCAYHCSAPRYWRHFEVDLLKQLATHIAIAIQQSELYQQVQTELAERRRAEEQLKASLKEKESLLKEVHHRVKNNLQIISSLLRLQSDYIKDEGVLALFKDSQNRIRSMSLIHEKLYQSSDLLGIHLAEYIHDLTANLLRSYTASPQAVNLKINADDIWLNIDTAIPCGLIINELISNSLKHAFVNTQRTQENEIRIDVYSKANYGYTLSIKDNGIGFPPNIDFQNTESLGLQLVCTFTEQIEGSIELEVSDGTTFNINFKKQGNIER